MYAFRGKIWGGGLYSENTVIYALDQTGNSALIITLIKIDWVKKQ